MEIEAAIKANAEELNGMFWYFVRRFRMDYDEVYSIACIAAAWALRKHKPDVGEFDDFLLRTVYHSLLRAAQTIARNRNRHRASELPTVIAEPRRFDLRRFLFELSDDAAHVVKELVYAGPPSRGYGRLRQMTTDLRAAGWSIPRINAAISEVRKEL